MFDPWTASLAEALDENRRTGSFSPLRQFLVAHGITKARPTILENGGTRLISCIAACAREGLIAPVWLAREFCKRVDVVTQGRAVSWDDAEVFGRPFKKGTHVGTEWRRHHRALQAWIIAGEIRQRIPSAPIDAGFFEEIGESMTPPVGKTEAEKSYYLAKQMISEGDSASLDDLFDELTNPGKIE